MTTDTGAEALHRLRYAVEALTKAFLNFNDNVGRVGMWNEEKQAPEPNTLQPIDADELRRQAAAERTRINQAPKMVGLPETDRETIAREGPKNQSFEAPLLTKFLGRHVRVHSHDYEFEGVVIAEFAKTNGKVRVVVEDEHGVCLIQSPQNLVWRDLYSKNGPTPVARHKL